MAAMCCIIISCYSGSNTRQLLELRQLMTVLVEETRRHPERCVITGR